MRELENKIERAVLLCDSDMLEISDFLEITRVSVDGSACDDITCVIGDSALSIKDAQKKLEAFLIAKALDKCGGNRTSKSRKAR